MAGLIFYCRFSLLVRNGITLLLCLDHVIPYWNNDVLKTDIGKECKHDRSVGGNINGINFTFFLTFGSVLAKNKSSQFTTL